MNFVNCSDCLHLHQRHTNVAVSRDELQWVTAVKIQAEFFWVVTHVNSTCNVTHGQFISLGESRLTLCYAMLRYADTKWRTQQLW